MEKAGLENTHGLTRSMSKKGCPPDNSAYRHILMANGYMWRRILQYKIQSADTAAGPRLLGKTDECNSLPAGVHAVMREMLQQAIILGASA